MNESPVSSEQGYSLDSRGSGTYTPPQLSSTTGSKSGIFQEPLAVLLAFGIAAIVLCYGLGRPALMWPDEGRNAEVAREMKEAGRWLIPTYNGADYLDKPALYFKAVALSLSAFGDTEFAARVPSMVSGLALLAITYVFCRRVCGRRCAALAVMVIGTTPLFVSYSRTVIFDITLTLFTCGAIFAGFLAEESDGTKRRNWYLVAAAAAGFATLVKGPVGFIVPLLVLLVANHGAQPGSIRRLFAPLNFVVFFAIVLPWFIGVSLAHPDFPRYGIVEESFHRFTTGSFRRSKPIYYYPYIIATTFFPWNLLIPGYIAAAWKRRGGWARIDRLCVGWSIVVFIFFSLSSSKMPGYILSLTVSLGILIARMFDRTLESREKDLRRAPLQATAVLGVVALIGSVVAIYLATDPMQFEQRVRLRVGEPEQFQDFWIPLVVTFLLIALVSAAALVRRSVRISFAALVTFPTAVILFNLGILEFTANRRSARNLSVELSSVAAKAKIACLECLPHGFPFYLGQTVTLFTKDGAELSSNYVLFSLKTGASWPSTLIAVANRDAWLDRQTEAIVVIARTESKPVLDEIAAARNGRVVGLTREYCALLLPARTTG